MTIHAGYNTRCEHNLNVSARVKSTISECSGQLDIPTRSRLSQHAMQMGDRSGRLILRLSSKNKTRPTRKYWASTLLAEVPATFKLELASLSQISGPGSIQRNVRFVIVSEHHRGCSTMQTGVPRARSVSNTVR